MIKQAISTVVAGEDLAPQDATAVMGEIMDGQATEAQLGSLLTALRLKGESIDEVSAFAAVMRDHALPFPHEVGDVLDIVGTGGDKLGTFNISTVAAIVASAAGIKVAKHGNRAASSKCGTADCLEALGVNLTADPVVHANSLETIGLAFLFAQKYHTSMRHVGAARREIGIPTVFNILGPLSNPAHVNLQLLGVYREDLVEPMARVLSNLGVERGMVVWGLEGLDEISSASPTAVCEIDGGQFSSYEFDPRDLGFTLCHKNQLVGGSPEENADIARRILAGETGPKRDAVLLNAAAALHIARGTDFGDGVAIAATTIDSGAAAAQLERFVELSNADPGQVA